MSGNVDEQIEQLLTDLKSASTTNWGSGHSAFKATPNAIERAIKNNTDGVDLRLVRLFYERAKLRFDQLIEQGDPYAETLRLASARLSQLLGSGAG
jgi:hypothetical protein